MSKQSKIIIGIVVIVIIIGFVGVFFQNKKTNDIKKDTVKIGVITALTGNMAYWGESTLAGIQLAKKDLEKEGINTDIIVEDGQLDPKIALNAVQKLVNIDKVEAVYSEFNPAAISVSSFLKDKNIVHIFDAAAISPLSTNTNTYKTYLDYEKSCAKAAIAVKSRGVEKVGVLKVNLEFGDLCLKGIKSVFGDNVFVEEYNAGTTDFKTNLLKLKSDNIGALFNASFQAETISSLKQARSMDMPKIFVGISEIVSPDIISQYSSLLEGSIMFDLPHIDNLFIKRVKEELPEINVSNYTAVSLVYIHIKQLARALLVCDKNTECVRKELDNSKQESIIGFMGFKDRIADFDIIIQEWKNGEFVRIE